MFYWGIYVNFPSRPFLPSWNLTTYELIVTACNGWSHKIVKLLWVLPIKWTLIGADGTTRKIRYIDFHWKRVAFTGRCYIWLTAQVVKLGWWDLMQNLHYYLNFTAEWHFICSTSKSRLSYQILNPINASVALI